MQRAYRVLNNGYGERRALDGSPEYWKLAGTLTVQRQLADDNLPIQLIYRGLSNVNHELPREENATAHNSHLVPTSGAWVGLGSSPGVVFVACLLVGNLTTPICDD
jgi:hypothetical protein